MLNFFFLYPFKNLVQNNYDHYLEGLYYGGIESSYYNVLYSALQYTAVKYSALRCGAIPAAGAKRLEVNRNIYRGHFSP